MTKILLIRLSSFGDILLATPAIRAIKIRYPEGLIDFVVYDRFAASLAFHPDVSRLFLLPKKKLKEHLARREFGLFWATLRTFISELRTTHYDFVIDLHSVTESALTALAARGRTKVGHNKQLLSLFFSIRSSFDVGFATATMHAAESNLQFLVDAGCLTPADLPKKTRLEFSVPEIAHREVDDYLARLGLEGKLLMGINPCASYDFKRWSTDRFAAVADFLAETFGATILVFGTPAEQPVVCQVMAAMKNPAIDTSHLSVYQAFELIGRLRLFVTNDSAPMHVAAALGTPLVALHGPINVKKFSPLTDVGRGISKDLPCLPCKDIALCTSRLCFDQVSVEEVCLACSDVLNSLAALSP
ncbi:MAG: glycosyltransferase family 9 protein [Desulfuromonadales bacterium]